MSRATPSGLLTPFERKQAAAALSAMLAGEWEISPKACAAAESALTKLSAPDPAPAVTECLRIALRAFSTNEDGPYWAESLIKRTRAALRRAGVPC